RSTDNSTFSSVTTTAANAVSYSDTGLSASTTYYYRIRATNGGGDSANSNVASATTASSGLPAAPTNLVATALSSSQIKLTWTNNATNTTEIRVSRSTDGARFNWLATITTDSTSFTDSGLTANTR